MTVNSRKLIGKIYEKGFTRTSFAKEIGITRQTLRNYLNQPKFIPYSVIVSIINTLDLTENELFEILFAKEG